MNLKQLFSASLLIAATAITSNAHARGHGHNHSYIGVNYSFLEQPIANADDAKLNTVNLRVGTFFDRSFSGEIRVGTGIGEDTIGGVLDVEIDQLIGAYLRSGVLTSGNLFPYLVAGVTQAKVTTKVAGAKNSESETDLSFGIGIDYTVKNSVSFNAEYINYISKNSVDISGFTLGVAKRF